jgi:hypothetical protein
MREVSGKHKIVCRGSNEPLILFLYKKEAKKKFFLHGPFETVYHANQEKQRIVLG